MKKSELKQLIREEVRKATNEGVEDPASNLLSLLASPDIKRYMDKLSDTVSNQEFGVIKDLYDRLYSELKKHE